MATAKEVFTSIDGAQFAFVLMIEGYDTLLTNWDDTDAVVSAYDTTTDWAKAITGLHVTDDLSERMELWSGKLDAPSIRFVISPDEDDTFGIDAHKTALSSGERGYIDVNIDNNDTAIGIDDSDDWGTSGDAYLGTELVTLSGNNTTTDTLTVTRGKFAPFKADTEANQRFGQYHAISNIEGNTAAPQITSYPRTWIGRKVRLVIHNVLESTGAGEDNLSSLNNSETLFAGTIEEISDTEEGNTVLECSHINDYIGKTLLLDDQFTGKLKGGVWIPEGHEFTWEENATINGSGGTSLFSTPLKVSTSDSFPNQIAEGLYTASELVARINDWIGADTDIDADKVCLDIAPDAGGVDRVVLRANWALVLSTDQAAFLLTLPISARFLFGYDDEEVLVYATDGDTDVKEKFAEQDPILYSPSPFWAIGKANIQVDAASGTWIDMSAHKEFLPDEFSGTTAGDWGFLRIGETVLAAKHVSDSLFTDISLLGDEAGKYFGGTPGSSGAIRGIERADPPTVKQVVVLQGTLTELILRILVSTGTSGYNHATYDDFDRQLGIALPYELMGSVAGYTLGAIESTTPALLTIVIEKPTTFGEIIQPELVLRNTHIVFDNGELHFKRPSMGFGTADHTLKVKGKATPVDVIDKDRTSSVKTRRYIKNKISVKYNRDGTGKYHGDYSIANLASITDHGGKVFPITLKARNTFGEGGGADVGVEEMLTYLASFALGLFSHELTVVTRTISRNHFGIKPGDTVKLTDDSVRSPDTGVRGITNYPGWVLSISRNWFTGVGQVEILIATIDGNNYHRYAPSGILTAYDTGTGVATLEANEFSRTVDFADDASFFDVGDKLRFIEISPTDIYSADSWEDEVASQAGNNITTVSNNGNGVYSGSKEYAVYYDTYDDATDDQRDESWQADDADNQILDLAVTNNWGVQNPYASSIPAVTIGQKHRFPSEDLWGDGEPCTPYHHQSAIYSVNNMLNFKMSSHGGVLPGKEESSNYHWRYASTSGTVWRLLFFYPMYINAAFESFGPAYEKQLKVAPLMYRVSGSGTVEMRVTSSVYKPTGDTLNDVSFKEPYNQVSFSTTSTTLTRVSAQNLKLVKTWPGTTWITVEIKAPNFATMAVGGITSCDVRKYI